jgi:hypothetical protein
MERLAAWTGLGFAIFLMVSGFLPGSPEKWNASPGDIQVYLVGKHTQLLAAAVLTGIAYVLFLWFLASFAGMFRDAGEGQLATIVYGAGVATVAIAAVADGLQLAMAKITYTADPNTIAAMYGAGSWLYNRIFFALAALAFASWLATKRSNAMPAWYGLLSLLAGGIWIISGVSVGDDGFFSVTGAMGMIGFISIAVWAGVSSLLLVQRVGAEAPSAAAAMG